jgi:two-component system cell cycle sensor histidine kinase/response regulator CckA
VSYQSPGPSESTSPADPDLHVPHEPRAQDRDGLQQRVVELDVMLAETTRVARGSLLDLEQPVERLPDIVVRLDARRRVEYVSPSIESATGLPPDAFIGKTILESGAPQDVVALWDAALRKVFETCQAESIEFSCTSPDGRARHFESPLIPEPAQDGSVRSVLAVVRDVTRHTLAERALREQATYRRLAEVAQQGMWAIDAHTNTTFVNRRMAEMLGYAPEEMIGRSLFDFMDEHGAQLAGTLWDRCRQGLAEQHTFDLRRKDGSHLPALLGTAPRFDAGADFAGAIAVVTDMTVFKRAEEALRESDRRLQSIFHLAPVGVGVLAERAIKEVNDHVCELTGYSRAEMLDHDTRFLYPTQDEYDIVATRWYAQIRETGKGSIETRWRRKDGRVIDVLLRVAAIDAADMAQGLMFAAQDVTELKRAEQTIRDGERRVRARLDTILAPEGDIGDLELGDIVDCEAVRALMDDFYRLTHIGMGIFDLRGRELVATTWSDICAKYHRVHPEAVRNCLESDTILTRGVAPGTFKLYQCQNHMWDMVTPLMLGDKHVGNLFLSQFLFDDEAPDPEAFRRQARQYGFDEQEYLAALDRVPRFSRETLDTAMTFYVKLAGMISQLSHRNVILARTVTERDRLLESLRDSEERYRTIVETAQEGIWQLDDQLRTTYVNREMADLLGYAPEEMIGRPVSDFVFEEDQEDHHAKMALRGRGQGERYERKVRRKDGSACWLLVSATPLFDAQGRFTGSFGMFTDITERRRAEQTLRDGERRVRAKLDAILAPEGDVGDLELGDILDCEAVKSLMDDFYRLTHIGMWIFDVHGRELVSTWWADICTKFHRVHPETIRHCVESDTILTQGVAPGEFKFYQCENHLCDLVTPLMLGEKHVGNLFLGQFLFDDEVDYETFRLQARQYGFDEKEYLAALDQVPRYSRETATIVISFYTKLANMISQLSHRNVILARTVTQRDRLLQSLRASEERYRTIVETAEEGIWQLDDEYRTTYVNRRMGELLGYSSEEMIGRPLADFVFEEDLTGHRERIAQRQRGVAGRRERKFRRKDGSACWLLVSRTPLLDAQERFTGSFAMLTDMTERKRAEEALRESEARYRALVETSPDGIALVSLDGEFLMVNQRGLAMYGAYDHGEMLGRNALEFVVPEERARAAEQMAKTLELGSAAGEYLISRKDGTRFPVDLGSSIVRDSAGQPLAFIGVLRDISERARAEQEKENLQAQLLQAQKMEAVGRLTAGVAHDFNNLLTVMVGFAELMKFQLVAGDPLLEMVDRVLSAGESAANLIRQLMAFSRQQVMQPQLLDLNSELARMERMLHRIIGEDITLEIRPCGDLWPVKVDPTQLQQVIANLVVNAREAMPKGGRVDISTTNVMLDDTQAARFTDARAGDYVLMRITDTGAGMSRDVQTRIFEPFFTTKEHGTGLGLATVFGIVSQSGGFVDLISAEGQGTTFAVYLPREKETTPAVVAAAPVAVAPSGGSETILLLEDSSQVREYAREVLRAQGYTVLEAGHGREALRITEEHVGPIHLLVTDVVMPGMSGRDAAQRLLAVHPGLKILYMSGYTDDVLETHGAFGAGVAFLQKPFGALELVRAVRRILDEAEA